MLRLYNIKFLSTVYQLPNYGKSGENQLQWCTTWKYRYGDSKLLITLSKLLSTPTLTHNHGKRNDMTIKSNINISQ